MRDEPTPTYLAGKLDGISLDHLEALLLRSASALEAAFNQPRMAGDDGAGDLLEDEIERLEAMRGEIVAEAERRIPTKRDDADRKARLLIRWGLIGGDKWSEIARAALTAMDGSHLPQGEADA